ncbi:TPA: hypothetical protein ACWL66_003698 [Morganella morganii]
MATIPTQNAVPSEAPRDLKFNSGKIDEFVTSLEHEYKDRFGRCHMTIEGMRWIFEQLMERFKVDINQAIIAAGYIPMDSFQQGAEITKRNEILRDETTGEYYRWDGDLPKAVPADSTPQSTGWIGKGAWVSVGDASVRSELKNENGSSLVRSHNYTINELIKSHLYSTDDFGDLNTSVNKLLLGDGAYTQDTIDLNDYNGIIEGKGYVNSSIKSINGLTALRSESNPDNPIYLKSFKLHGDGTPSASAPPIVGINLDKTHWSDISDLYITGYHVGLKMYDSWLNNLSNVNFRDCRTGLELGRASNAVNLTRLGFSDCYDQCVLLTGTSQAVTMTSCDIEFSGSHGITIDGVVRSLNLYGCYIGEEIHKNVINITNYANIYINGGISMYGKYTGSYLMRLTGNDTVVTFRDCEIVDQAASVSFSHLVSPESTGGTFTMHNSHIATGQGGTLPGDFIGYGDKYHNIAGNCFGKDWAPSVNATVQKMGVSGICKSTTTDKNLMMLSEIDKNFIPESISLLIIVYESNCECEIGYSARNDGTGTLSGISLLPNSNSSEITRVNAVLTTITEEQKTSLNYLYIKSITPSSSNYFRLKEIYFTDSRMRGKRSGAIRNLYKSL